MAVDGSLVFNTKIDADGFDKGTKGLSSRVIDLKNKIASTEATINNLKAELEKTGDVKVKTKIAEGLEKDLEKAKERLREYGAQADQIGNAKQAELSGLGFGDDYLDKALEQDKAWQQIQERISQAEAQVARYTRALNQANNAAPLTKDTAEYKQKEQRLSELSGQLNVYRAKLDETKQAESRQASQTSRASDNLENAKSKLALTISALKMFAKGAARAGRALKTAFSKTAGKLISHIGDHFRKANNSTNVFEKSLRRIKNTLVRMFFFRLVHSPIDAVKDGLGEISKISPEVNKNLSALKTESTYLKNALAALAAPLLNLVTPALTSFMQALSDITSKAGQLVAVLTGQSYTKAIKVQQDYAASLDDSTKSANKNTKALEKNQRALAGFDELNVLEQQEDNSNEAESSTPMFENIGNQINGLSGSLIDALKNQDFGAVGEMLGEKINSVLGKINWESIKSTAKTWAGNIADFLNGFIAKTNWNLVGETIANGIGTAILFALTLIQRFNFAGFGAAVGNLINGLLSPENAGNFANAASSLLVGLLTALTAAVQTINWGKVGQTIIAFITNFRLGDIVVGATNLVNALAGAITQTDFASVGEAFRKKIANIDWKGLWDGVVNLFTSALQGAGDFLGLNIDTSNLKKELQNVSEPIAELFSALKTSFGELLTPIVNSLLPAAVRFIGSLAKGLSPIIKALTPFLKTVIGLVSRLLVALSPVLPKLGDMLGKLVTMVIPIVEPFLISITESTEALAPILSVIFTRLGAIFELLTPLFEMIGEAVNLVTSVVSGIIQALGGVLQFIAGIFTGDWEMAWDGIKNIVDGILNKIVGGFRKAWENIKNAFGSVAEWFRNIFSRAWEYIKFAWRGPKEFFSNIWTGIKNAFNNVGEWFSGIFSGAWEGIKTAWNSVTTFFSGIWEKIKQPFVSVGTWFSEIFEKAVSGIKTAWDGIKTWFSDLWNGIWQVIRTPICWIIDGINAIINGLNSISITVPKWVPKYGGKTIGFNLSTVAYPPEHLANGTVVPANYGEFLAVLGDNKRETEVVSPLSTMKQAFLEAIAEGGFKGGEKEINLYIDGEKFFSWLIGKSNSYQKTHGYSAFTTGGVD